MSTEPPRLARALLTAIPDSSTRALVRLDLHEELQLLVAAGRELRAARAWYRRVALRSVAAWWREQLRRTLFASATPSGGRPTPGRGVTHDLRYALRMVRRTPASGLTVVATIAGSIAVTASIASVVMAVLVAPLPFDEPDRIVRIERTSVAGERGWGVVGYPDMVQWRERTRAFEAIAGLSLGGATFLPPGLDPMRLRTATVTHGFERVLGIAPQLGRSFRDDEFLPGGDQVTLLADGFWRRQFGADPAVVGEPIDLDGVVYRVVGVLPPSHLAYPDADLWLPMAFASDAWQVNVRGASWMTALGRVGPGSTLATAGEELSAIQANLVREFPRDNDNQQRVALVPLKEVLVGESRSTMLLLAASFTAVMLLACANVGVLLATQASRRRQEFAVRAALGAGRGRLARQLLAESMTLAVAGGVIAATAVPWLTMQIVDLYPGSLPRSGEITVDATTFALVAALVAAAGFGSGVVSWLLLLRRGGADAVLREQTQGPGRGAIRLRQILATAQAAVCVVVLAGSALFVATLFNLSSQDPGFRSADLIRFNLALPAARYPGAAATAFSRALLDSLREVPGVRDVGASTSLPFGGEIWGGDFTVTDMETPVEHSAMVRVSWPGTYSTLDVPVVAGRPFDERDDEDSARVLMLNQTAATTAFPGADPIGRTVLFQDQPWQIIGVLGDVRHRDLGAEPVAELHVPGLQLPRSRFGVVVHVDGASEAMVGAIRDVVRSHDPGLAVTSLTSMQERIASSLAPQRFRAVLVAVLGAAALLLALVGIYGVVASGVSQQHREIGVRMALGEARPSVLRRVIAEAGRLAAAGGLAGSIIVLLAAPTLSPFLFGIGSRNPLVLVGIPLTLLVFAGLAALPSAIRASRTDPSEAMRSR